MKNTVIQQRITKMEERIKYLKDYLSNISSCTITKQLVPQQKFTQQDIDNCHNSLECPISSSIGGKQTYLYIIRAKYNNALSVQEAFQDFKTANVDYKVSTVNRANTSKNKDGVLYVGSSSSIITRMNEHLGITGQKVYSLQLKHWALSLFTEVEIELIPIEPKYIDILYDLEDALWDYYRPLFGKKGANPATNSKP
ncbi:MAG: hypothetical protein ACRCZB_05775 [Bacteroidales bacterium]